MERTEEKREEVAQPTAEPKEVPKPTVLDFPPLPKGDAAQQLSKEVKQIYQNMKGLLKSNKDARLCAETLLLGYQLQQWASYAMGQMHLEEKVVHMILRHVQAKATQAFMEEDTRDDLRDKALPFMSERILEHVKTRTENAKLLAAEPVTEEGEPS